MVIWRGSRLHFFPFLCLVWNLNIINYNIEIQIWYSLISSRVICGNVNSRFDFRCLTTQLQRTDLFGWIQRISSVFSWNFTHWYHNTIEQYSVHINATSSSLIGFSLVLPGSIVFNCVSPRCYFFCTDQQAAWTDTDSKPNSTGVQTGAGARISLTRMCCATLVSRRPLFFFP